MMYIKKGNNLEFTFSKKDRPDVSITVVNLGSLYQVHYPVYNGLDVSLGIKSIDKSELKEFLDFVIFKKDLEMKILLNY